jgi:hypothetical protein
VIADNCLVPFPTITPPNWATIATGAMPGTHQVTDFHVPTPGATPDNSTAVQAFGSQRWQAEAIWEAMDKAGKKAIVLNFPGAWPSKMKNGIMVGGGGLTPIENRDGKPGMDIVVNLCNEMLITTGVYPGAIRGKFQPAEGWANAKEMGEEPLEMEAPLRFAGAQDKPARASWYVLVRQSTGNGYDTATLSPTKDLQDAFCTLKVGEWSPRTVTNIKMEDGSEREVFFRSKLLELSEDAEDFRLFVTALAGTEGWSDPPAVAKELFSEEGAIAGGGGLRSYSIGWIDLDTYVELNEQYTQFLADAATTLLTKHEWDGFFMHSHPTDWAYHILMTDLDPITSTDPEKHRIAWDAHLRIYETQDRLLEKILSVLDKDTLVILVSDHGATADGPTFDPYKALVPAGLATLKAEGRGPYGTGTSHLAQEMSVRNAKPDTTKSKAIAQRSIYVYVNLKGRDPEGIVEPEDYEKVQYEIVDALYRYVDPETGKRPVALALAKKDARILGLFGDGIGDVVYAVYPWFGSQHGQILPTGEWGLGNLRALFTMTGPGIKKGYRLQRTCGIVDLVPTICYLLDLPVPEQAEGAILYQAFKDPDFKLKEIQKLRDGLARLETALARQEREPWDKHECA